jgi:methylated-DNA-[protein]-cysteine S-methyltransferase
MRSSEPVLLRLAECESPVGGITMAVKDGRLCALGFTDRWGGLYAWLERRFGEIRTEAAADPAGVTGRMRAYIAGDMRALDDIALDPGGTPFQYKVWMALCETAPAGQTISYGHLARTVGLPNASRAVGAANGANPISIVIPCHRVIGTNGKLTGYGGGLPRKQWLLEHEGVRPGALPSPAPNPTLPLW